MKEFKAYMKQQKATGKTLTLSLAKDFFIRDKHKNCFYSFFQEQLELWQFSKSVNTLKSYRSTLNVLKYSDLSFVSMI